MSLAFGKSSLHDILAKAERDFGRLEAAQVAQDEAAGSDSLFDLAVTLTSLKDWLKEHPGRSFTSDAVEDYIANSIALSSFRDIANAGKHRVIRRYVPVTADVTVSVSTSAEIVTIFSEDDTPALPKPFRRLKIIRADGARYRAIDLGRDAIREWQSFFQQNGI